MNTDSIWILRASNRASSSKDLALLGKKTLAFPFRSVARRFEKSNTIFPLLKIVLHSASISSFSSSFSASILLQISSPNKISKAIFSTPGFSLLSSPIKSHLTFIIASSIFVSNSSSFRSTNRQNLGPNFKTSISSAFNSSFSPSPTTITGSFISSAIILFSPSHIRGYPIDFFNSSSTSTIFFILNFFTRWEIFLLWSSLSFLLSTLVADLTSAIRLLHLLDLDPSESSIRPLSQFLLLLNLSPWRILSLSLYLRDTATISSWNFFTTPLLLCNNLNLFSWLSAKNSSSLRQMSFLFNSNKSLLLSSAWTSFLHTFLNSLISLAAITETADRNT